MRLRPQDRLKQRIIDGERNGLVEELEEARSAGIAPLDIVQAPAFKLLCLDTTEVIDALGEMNRVGALRFRMQGDVVELDVRGA